MANPRFKVHLSAQQQGAENVYFGLGPWLTSDAFDACNVGALFDTTHGGIIAPSHCLVQVEAQIQVTSGAADPPSVHGIKWVINPVISTAPADAGIGPQSGWREALIGRQGPTMGSMVSGGIAEIELQAGNILALFCYVTGNGAPVLVDSHHCHTWWSGRLLEIL